MVCYTRDKKPPPHPPYNYSSCWSSVSFVTELQYRSSHLKTGWGGVLTWRYGYWPCLMKLLIIRPCRTGVLSLFPWRTQTWEGTKGGHVMTRVYFLIRGKYRTHKLRANVCWRTAIIVPMCPSMVSVGFMVSSCLWVTLYWVILFILVIHNQGCLNHRRLLLLLPLGVWTVGWGGLSSPCLNMRLEWSRHKWSPFKRPVCTLS